LDSQRKINPLSNKSPSHQVTKNKRRCTDDHTIIHNELRTKFICYLLKDSRVLELNFIIVIEDGNHLVYHLLLSILNG
jgi:hypothetical protein